jgi:hypothetical protein
MAATKSFVLDPRVVMLEIKPEEIGKIVNTAKLFALFNRGVREILDSMRKTACQKVEYDDRFASTLGVYAKRESTRVGLGLSNSSAWLPSRPSCLTFPSPRHQHIRLLSQPVLSFVRPIQLPYLWIRIKRACHHDLGSVAVQLSNNRGINITTYQWFIQRRNKPIPITVHIDDLREVKSS